MHILDHISDSTSATLIGLGLIIFFALLCGALGERLRLPKVTSYLIAGLLIGPSGLSIVSHETLEGYLPITDVAMALVLFNLGAHFSINFLTKIKRHLIPVAIGDLVVTFAMVAIGMLLLKQTLHTSLMLGCLAMATAPATTVLVLKDLRSEGPVTELAQALVAVNNLVTIVVFELIFLGFAFFGSSGDMTPSSQLVTFVIEFGAAIAIGVTFGLILSYVSSAFAPVAWVTMLIATAAIGVGICSEFDLSFMLTMLVAGFVFVNTAQEAQNSVPESERIATILCVVFFSVHGAELKLDQFIGLGLVGAAYVVLRVAGKCLGTYVFARLSHEAPEVRKWLGSTMLSQAGAAITLSAIAVSRDQDTYLTVQTLILGSVVVFEVLGPILIRFSVLRSGEAPIAHAIRHTNQTMGGRLIGMWWQFRTASGADPIPTISKVGMTINELVRLRVEGIPQSADFDQVIAHIEHSHDNTFPVVDSENKLVGVIRYPLLSKSLFDPSVGKLVRAIDIATPVDQVANPDELASVAIRFFQKSSDDCIPVVSNNEDMEFMGVVRRADVRAILIRKRNEGKSGGH